MSEWSLTGRTSLPVLGQVARSWVHESRGFFSALVSEEMAPIIRRLHSYEEKEAGRLEGEYNCHLFLDILMFQFEADRFVAASLVSQQNQYLMSGPANHMSSSGREAFSPAVQWSEVYLQLQSGVDVGLDNNEWKSWTSTALPPCLSGNSNTLSFPSAPLALLPDF